MWDDFCITDVDLATYAEVPINEMVFWSDGDGGIVEVELPAFRVKLKRKSEEASYTETEKGAKLDLTVQI